MLEWIKDTIIPLLMIFWPLIIILIFPDSIIAKILVIMYVIAFFRGLIQGGAKV